MLLLLPFALFGLAALFYLLIRASARALSFAVAACTAFAVHAATGSIGAAALAAAPLFLLAEAAIAAGGVRFAGSRAGAALDALILVPAALAGWSVGALGAAWLGMAPVVPAVAAAFAACLMARRRGPARPV